jgi:hypothetical protein
MGIANRVVVAAPPNALKMVLEKSWEETIVMPKKKVISSFPMPAKTACGKIWFMKIV